MRAKAFSIQRGEPKRLLMTWETGLKDINLYFDGEHLTPTLSDRATLPDGSILTYKFNAVGRPLVRRNHRPLPGSADDPVSRIPLAAGIAIFLGITYSLQAVLSLLGYDLFGFEEDRNRAVQVVLQRTYLDPLDVIYLIVGVIILISGISVALRKRFALWIAIWLYGIDSLLFGIQALGFLDVELILIIALRVAFVYAMYRGFTGFDVLEYEAAERSLAERREQKISYRADLPDLPDFLREVR